MNKVLSIIIPSCNMEKYLSQCLDSLLVPNIDDVEILVINDGSKDRTSEIAHGYEKQYPESIRVIDKPNGHYGSCINRGLKEATGKYVKVLDADDSFDTKVFEKFIEFLKNIETDIIFSNYCIVNESGTITSTKNFPIIKRDDSKPMSFKKALRLFLDSNMAMHGITYRTNLLKGINYHQTEGVAYTDQEWIFEPALNVRTVEQFPEVLYRYLVGRIGQSIDNSVVTKSISLQMRHCSKRLDDYERLSSNLTEEQNQFAFARLKFTMISNFNRIIFGKSSKDQTIFMLSLDKKLESIYPELYLSLNQEKIQPFIPFHYIKYWRKKIKDGKSLILINLIKFLIKLR